MLLALAQLIGCCLVQLGMGVLWQRATGFTGTSLGLCCHYGIRHSCTHFEGIQAVQVGLLLTFLGPLQKGFCWFDGYAGGIAI